GAEMQTVSHSYDPELAQLIERNQRKCLRAARFNPKTFAKRTDAAEFTPASRLAMWLLAFLLRCMGRAGLANNVNRALDYMSRVSDKVTRLPAALAGIERIYPEPVTKYQRRDDHYFL